MISPVNTLREIYRNPLFLKDPCPGVMKSHKVILLLALTFVLRTKDASKIARAIRIAPGRFAILKYWTPLSVRTNGTESLLIIMDPNRIIRVTEEIIIL